MRNLFHCFVLRRWGPAWALLASGACSLHSQAGRPISTDDAAILAPGECQMESWWQQSAGLRQQVLQPSCNFGGRFEWGGSVTGTQGSQSTAAGLGALQLKWVPHEAEVDGWAGGLTASTSQPLHARRTGDASSESGPAANASTQTLTALLTLAPSSHWLLHANVGVSHRAGRSKGIWAAAAEYTISDRCGVHVEAFGEHQGRTTLQLGARYWLVADRVQIDTSLGRQPRSDGTAGGERVATLGLVWVWSGQ